MTLDVVIPTYNRCTLLQATLASLLRAPVPPSLQINLYVVENNCTDCTAEMVRELAAQSALPLHHVHEPQQGSSYARNAGIRAGRGELIGFVDDDEEVDLGWYKVIAHELRDEAVQFIGGPCLPKWESPAPRWLPPGYHSVIGAIPPKPRAPYDDKHPGILNGGNAVLRRTVFEQVGLYAEYLGRGANDLLSEEDAELFKRLRQARLFGMYVPELMILHFVPASRLTRSYHRRWAYSRAISQGLVDRDTPEHVVHLFGIPRYRVGRTFRALASLPGHWLAGGGRAKAFADELALWELVGFIRGRHFARRKR